LAPAQAAALALDRVCLVEPALAGTLVHLAGGALDHGGGGALREVQDERCVIVPPMLVPRITAFAAPR
jgi:hypothetical protein